MRVTAGLVIAVSILASPCLAQEWELGGAGGYGFYTNPTIRSTLGSVEPGFAPKGAIGVVFGQNMYEHLGGEVRWLYQFGGPELKYSGTVASATGYSNLVTYDLLFHMSNREARLRPYVAAGAGVKAFTSRELRSTGQPIVAPVFLLSHTQAEPAISAGVGLKYKITEHAVLRLDFRTYFSPCPDDIFRPIATSTIHGWIYNFVPLGGISYVF